MFFIGIVLWYLGYLNYLYFLEQKFGIYIVFFLVGFTLFLNWYELEKDGLYNKEKYYTAILGKLTGTLGNSALGGGIIYSIDRLLF